ncbi:MAG TPA: zf-HC2 domain-containing protein [Myxococcota bacterium]|nr:zf-HC2 domain-containing protein [Myxococcota bacterium]
MTSRLTCRELIEFLDDYVDQRLAAPERARFDDHLERCPACRRYLMGYQGTLRAVALAWAPDAAAPPEVPSELVAAILASRRAS